jgi:Transposase, Mutator family
MGANPSGQEGGAPIENQRTLRIHLVLEVSIPEGTPLFQALTLAFWRFQGVAVPTLFTAVLQAIEARTQTDLAARFPGRFRHKGRSQARQWQLPFGLVRFALAKLWDPGARRTVYPLREAMELPRYVRWCEETLVPGYRLAVLQSFRQSQGAVRGLAPDGRAPSHSTVHRRFQGFAATLDPVPEYTHRPGPKPAAYQQADGTQLKLQAQGHPAGSADLRLVVGSRTPHGPLEVLDYSVGDTWEAIAQRLRQRFPTPPKVLVSDGEEGIPEALAGPATRHQRCLVHGRRNLPFALYQDGYRKADRGRIERAFARIPGLQLSQAELARVDPSDKAAIRELLAASEQAFLALRRRLPKADFPHTRRYVLGLIEDGLAYLRHLLATGETILLSTNRLESIWSRVLLRLKQIGRRWSAPGALHMLAACLGYALHPKRYAEAEAARRKEHLPQLSVLITSLETVWAS